MKKIILVIFTLYCYAIAGYNINWEQKYSDGISNNEREIVKLSDGSILYHGSYRNSGSSFGTIVLSKIGTNGALIWKKEFTDINQTYITKVIEDNSGNIIYTAISGIGTNTSDIVVGKLDSSGNEVWKKIYGTSGYESASDIVCNTNSITIVGTRMISSGNHDILIFNLDHNGNLQWEKLYGGNYSESIRKISLYENKLYIFGSSQEYSDYESQKALVIKYDINGTLEWDKKFDYLSQSDMISTRIVNSDGIVIIISQDMPYNNNGGGAVIVRMDNNGNVIKKRIFNINTNFNLMSIEKTANGYLVAGSFSDTTSGTQGRLFQLDNDFNTVWDKYIGQTDSFYGYSYDVIMTDQNENIYHATNRKNTSYNADYDNWSENLLVKLDKYGNILDETSFSTDYTIKKDANGNWVGLGHSAFIDLIDIDESNNLILGTYKIENSQVNSWVMKMNFNDDISLTDSNNNVTIQHPNRL